MSKKWKTLESDIIKGTTPDFKIEQCSLKFDVVTFWSKLIPSFMNAFSVQLLYRIDFQNTFLSFKGGILSQKCKKNHQLASQFKTD